MEKHTPIYHNALLYIKKIAKSNTKILLLYIFLVGCVAWIQAFLPFIARLETDQLVQKNWHFFFLVSASPFMVFVMIAWIVTFVSIFQNLLDQLKLFVEQMSTTEMEQKYVSSLIARLSHMSLGKYLNKRNQKFISSFWSADLLGAIRSVFIDSLFVNIIRFSGIVAAFMELNLYIFVPMLISIAISLFLDFSSERVSRKYTLQAQYTHDHKLWDIKRHLTDSFDKIVSSWWREKTISIYNDLIEQKMSFDRERSKAGVWYSLGSSLNTTLWWFIVKLIVAYIIISGGATVWVMTMALMYVWQIRSFFRATFSTKQKRDTMIDEFQRLNLYLDMTSSSFDTDQPWRVYSQPFYHKLHTISIKNITFAYPKVSPEELAAYQIMIKRLQSYGNRKITWLIKDKISFMQDAFEETKKPALPVLKNISYTFEKWKVYGIVWHNGAGKTTLMTLLMNYFPEYKGTITYNTTNLKKIDPASCVDLFSVIMQDPFVFYFLSIKENLLLGVNKQYSDDELFAYLGEFGLEQKVRKMRKWLDSNIGYDSDFSGWEKQILVLIRILLQDKPILIVDEGTGQLDAENEMRIMEKLLQKKEDKIIIFIAHRMSVMKYVDTILCIEKGEITDTWTPKDLLSRPSLYKSFWEYQIGA